jgi:hypothetical protein
MGWIRGVPSVQSKAARTDSMMRLHGVATYSF